MAHGLCFALAAITVLWSLTLPAGFFDDGIQLSSGMFVLRGQRPNIDFHSVYPPLNAYLLAGAFRLLGESIVTYRIVQTAASTIVIFATASLLRASAAHVRPLVGLAILVLGAALNTLQAATALMWSVLALLLVLRARALYGAKRFLSLGLAGLLLGLLAMTRLNFALYLAAAWLLDCAMVLMHEKSRPAWRDLSSATAALFLPALGIMAIVLALWGGAVSELLRQVVVVTAQSILARVDPPIATEPSLANLRTFILSGLLVVPLPTAWLAARAHGLNHEPAVRLLRLVSAGTFVVCVAVAAIRPTILPAFTGLQVLAVLIARRKLPWLTRDEWFVLLVLSLQLHYVLSRPDFAHGCALLPMVAFLIAVVVRSESFRFEPGLALLLFLSCGPPSLYVLRIMAKDLLARGGSITAVPTLLRTQDEALYHGCGPACDVFRADAAEFAAVQFVRERTRLDEPVFSGVRYGNAAGVNDVRAYWNMRRPSGTRHIIMQNGITSMPERQEEIVLDLLERHVEWLVLWGGASAPSPKRAAHAPGPLETFIRAKFSLAASFKDYEVWQLSDRTGEAQMRSETPSR